jgi:2-octaprenyl-6-methoxyphenol hydroxylase
MTQSNGKQFDVVIVGGGMAGATMALALAPLEITIAVIEAHPYQDGQSQPSFDDRCLALSWSSRQIYSAMGIWQILAQQEPSGYAAIKKIHISDRGHMGAVRLNHQQEGVPALGYVVESRVIGEVLIQKLKQQKNVQLFSPATIKALETHEEQVKLNINSASNNDSQQISTKLLIIADGVNSKTRELLDVRVNQRSYGQTAVIANVETQLAHENVAYERFTDTGPLALLPLTRERCSLVWTAKDEQVEHLLTMNDEEFSAALQQRFGYRLGVIEKVGKRSAYPLALMTVDNDTLKHQNRIALIGNAAHGVHPVAGQGFNLGLRDISALAELIRDEMKNKHADPGNRQLTEHYWQWRQADIRQVTTITNGLINVFSNNFIPLAIARNVGLLMTDIISPLKHAVAHEAMGNGMLQGRLSQMAAGQSLY